MIRRSLFPSFAWFGPTFIVIGLRTNDTFGLAIAIAGAWMTSGALHTIYLALNKLKDPPTEPLPT